MKKQKSGTRDAAPRGFGLHQIPRFKFTGKLRPGRLSPRRTVPETVPRPDYWKDGRPKAKLPRYPWEIDSLNEEQIERMRESGRMAREILDIAGRMVKPGVLTDEIDAVVHEEIVKRGAYPSPLNYNNFPKSCCTSINEVVCHGIPDNTALVDGDIINIDITVFHNGFHGDCSETFLVGDVDEKGRKLARVTHECLEKAIEICKPGLAVKKIGGVIEDHARRHGFSVVRNFCGHGVNSVFHTTPNVMHFKNNEPAGILKPGVTFTIEPMINEGTHRNVVWPDDWTATTLDGRRSAQFEHTLLITETGVERLTQKIESSPKFFWEE
ncbi:Methionine aminopeptidase 1A [Gracilariopsis chorda]|uniref:Methionine aminopeptidase n=1 Tax=Gracilariopsis chorda TaxID=448386 RepID=A0A2V3IT59_9FLOR|nr:Methionine aminopeptidase 1A [Gracilariopsis chorda]|eukprot:PXF45294.1 Methionine aminopeptidase 1A [Gracilariopsis chorda]